MQHYMCYAKVDELNDDAKLKATKKQTLIFTKSTHKAADYCRHLRNSFCHAIIHKADKVIYIPDKKSNKRFTSKGYIDYNIMIEFVKSIIAEYEDKYYGKYNQGK